MARSTKIDTVKDKNGPKTRAYHRLLRRAEGIALHNMTKFYQDECGWDFEGYEEYYQGLKDIEDFLVNPKTLINDYDYCDHIFMNCGEKYTRK